MAPAAITIRNRSRRLQVGEELRLREAETGPKSRQCCLGPRKAFFYFDVVVDIFSSPGNMSKKNDLKSF